MARPTHRCRSLISGGPRGVLSADCLAGAAAFALASVPVCLGVLFGAEIISRPGTGEGRHNAAFRPCFHFDALHYESIVERGYVYDPLKPSTVAFFPGYPLGARALASMTGLSTRAALMLTSNLMLLGALALFAWYMRVRLPCGPPSARPLALVLMGLWPASFFYRMPYSESTFLVAALVVMLGIADQWRLWLLCFFSGLASAVRPVGIGVVAALAWHILSNASPGSFTRRFSIAIGHLPLACWGLLAYMSYQYGAFGTPISFIQTQQHWSNQRASPTDLRTKLGSLAVAEPMWAPYISDSAWNWRRLDSQDNAAFSMAFWNPIFFVTALLLVLLGAAKYWLSGPEVVLGLGLLAIPYFGRAYEMCMASHARFAAVTFPAYIVLARILVVQRRWIRWSVLALASILLTVWSALFAAGYPLY